MLSALKAQNVEKKLQSSFIMPDNICKDSTRAICFVAESNVFVKVRLKIEEIKRETAPSEMPGDYVVVACLIARFPCCCAHALAGA